MRCTTDYGDGGPRASKSRNLGREQSLKDCVNWSERKPLWCIVRKSASGQDQERADGDTCFRPSNRCLAKRGSANALA